MANAKQERIQFRIDAEEKKKAEEILKSTGLNMSQLLTLCIKQLIITGQVPFPIRGELKIPDDVKDAFIE
jgi:addiction module RelB/DinJ family antitoxin